MFAGNFRVVQLDGVARAATNGHGCIVQLEPRPLIAALNYEQRWHDDKLRGGWMAARRVTGKRYTLGTLPGVPFGCVAAELRLSLPATVDWG
jgi:hypothetical protein